MDSLDMRLDREERERKEAEERRAREEERQRKIDYFISIKPKLTAFRVRGGPCRALVRGGGGASGTCVFVPYPRSCGHRGAVQRVFISMCGRLFCTPPLPPPLPHFCRAGLPSSNA
jgi:hypothetical protein